jgi:hypothetical protein
MRLADVSSRQPAAITRHQRLIVDVVVVVHEVSLPCVRLRYRVKGFVQYQFWLVVHEVSLLCVRLRYRVKGFG